MGNHPCALSGLLVTLIRCPGSQFRPILVLSPIVEREGRCRAHVVLRALVQYKRGENGRGEWERESPSHATSIAIFMGSLAFAQRNSLRSFPLPLACSRAPRPSIDPLGAPTNAGAAIKHLGTDPHRSPKSPYLCHLYIIYYIDIGCTYYN